ncbi:MAG: phosphodiester glycosidase family protein [Chthoniobacterales bacterium]
MAVSAEDGKTGDTAQLQCAVFETKNATMRVLDQPSEPRISLAEMMRRESCLAGVNGGYFDPEHAAVGLLISDGQTVQAKQKAKLLSGVVSVVNGRLQIERSGAFSPKKKPADARQCGPFLVERGRAVAGLNNARAARRTFILVADKGRAAIGYASDVTLAQLGDLLATPGLAPDLKVQSALNLDGGSSSGFWFAGDDEAFAIREYKTVRDFIGIVARP